MRTGKICCFIIHISSATGFGRFCDDHRGSLQEYW